MEDCIIGLEKMCLITLTETAIYTINNPALRR